MKMTRGKPDQILRGLALQHCQLMSRAEVISNIKTLVLGLSLNKIFLDLKRCKPQFSGYEQTLDITIVRYL